MSTNQRVQRILDVIDEALDEYDREVASGRLARRVARYVPSPLGRAA